MAEETQAQETAEQAEQVDESTDWQAKYESMREHMREWERKAKANQSAADELEKLKAEQMTEQEKAVARAEAAEKELEALKAEKSKNDAARRLSNETGVPFEMLMFCTDEDSMGEFARTYKAIQPEPIHAAATANGTRVLASKDAQGRSSKEAFLQFASEAFNQ